MSLPPRATVVTVTYRSRRLIDASLTELRRSYEAGLVRCVLVDNASDDSTADFVRATHPWVTVVEPGRNLGFGRGCNLGSERAETEYVVFLNPDASMPPEAFRTLLDFMDRHPNAGIAGPAIIEGGSELQHTEALLTPGRQVMRSLGLPGWRRGFRLIEPGRPPFEVEWLCGAAMAVRRREFEQIGGFDPRFFLYFEETDLCRRYRAAGRELWAVGEAIARHVGGASAATTGESIASGCLAQHYYESRFYYFRKHFGTAAALATELADSVAGAVRWLAEGRRAGVRPRTPVLRSPAAGDAA